MEKTGRRASQRFKVRFIVRILALIAALVFFSTASIGAKQLMEKKDTSGSINSRWFGKTASGAEIESFELRSRSGMVANVCTYGATLVSLFVPNKDGSKTNVVLGFDNIRQYEEESPYFGATIGRVANRIARGEFELNSVRYALVANNGPNALHGGLKGFDKRVWSAQPFERSSERGVILQYESADMEEGFPGKLSVSVTYTLNDMNELRIDYEARTNKSTPVNLTNHSYFNLRGAGNGDVVSHELTINADRYTPVDENLIPIGTLESVEKTAMDFRSATAIGAHLSETTSGYDHNYVLNRSESVDSHPDTNQEVINAAQVLEPLSGRRLTMFTSEPGVQFYSGNFLDGSVTGNGGVYKKHSGFCLEAQHFPDSVHRPNFPSTILNPDQVYRQTTIYKVSVN